MILNVSKLAHFAVLMTEVEIAYHVSVDMKLTMDNVLFLNQEIHIAKSMIIIIKIIVMNVIKDISPSVENVNNKIHSVRL